MTTDAASCKHEPFERMTTYADAKGGQIRLFEAVVFLLDTSTQQYLTHGPPSAGYYRRMAHDSAIQRLAVDPYAVMGCRHCGALFVGPQPPRRTIVDGDPYRSEGG